MMDKKIVKIPHYKPVRMNVCNNCALCFESNLTHCPECRQAAYRSCHTKSCVETVLGDVGTKCGKCKTTVKGESCPTH